ncbi:hypothetical protein [Viridibacillus arvi]|uniref:hypothetical protein n=1 Tax=Viridibacillus arvi TaxID=263475 RepID=UPI0034D004FB
MDFEDDENCYHCGYCGHVIEVLRTTITKNLPHESTIWPKKATALSILKGAKTSMNTNEQFLDFEIKLVSQMLGVEFQGSTLQEKVDFYTKHKDHLGNTKERMFMEMYTAHNAKVFRFGDGINETDWVVAESKENAIEHYGKNVKDLTNEIDINDYEIKEIDTQVDFMLFETEEVPVSDRMIFKCSEKNEGHLEVLFIYAIDYALQNGMKLPFIIQSFE